MLFSSYHYVRWDGARVGLLLLHSIAAPVGVYLPIPRWGVHYSSVDSDIIKPMLNVFTRFIELFFAAQQAIFKSDSVSFRAVVTHAHKMSIGHALFHFSEQFLAERRKASKID